MKERKRWRIWVHSDLQLAVPSHAQTVLRAAIDDLLELNLGLDAAWCLGDALCGDDTEPLEAVARINIEELGRLGVPITYILGNHEMDLKRWHDLNRYPLYELAAGDPKWRVGGCDSFYFTEVIGETLIIFMGDHFAKDGSWWTTHGLIKGHSASYPHLPGAYRALREKITGHLGPVIIASHYALPGGQRPSPLLTHLLPLPSNVHLHLHGHAHIGDLVHNREYPWRRMNPINGEAVPQFNISALETARSPGSHSALLEIGEDGPISLQIRCHLQREWIEAFDLRSSSLTCSNSPLHGREPPYS